MLRRLNRHRDRHVLMTTDAVGGIWTYALDLGTALLARDHAVTLAVLGPPASPAQRRDAAARGLVVADTACPPDWLAEDAAEVERAGAAVAALARLLGVGAIHLNHPALAAFRGFDKPVVCVQHSCVASWWEAVRGTPLPADFRWRTDLVGRGLEAADAVAAPSAAFAEVTQRLYGLASRPAVVPNGRPPAPLSDSAPAALVFTAGRLWDEGKNAAALERIAPRLSVRVEAAGALRGPNGARIAFAHVRALGALDEAGVRARLAARPVYAAPAFYEPFGLAVLEAAQAGCALVLGDIPTFRELWGEAAVFVDPNDDDALLRAIAGLLADPEARAHRGRAAATAAARFTVEAMAEAMARLYGTASVEPSPARARRGLPRAESAADRGGASP